MWVEEDRGSGYFSQCLVRNTVRNSYLTGGYDLGHLSKSLAERKSQAEDGEEIRTPRARRTRREVAVLRLPGENWCHGDTFPATWAPVGQPREKPGGQGSPGKIKFKGQASAMQKSVGAEPGWIWKQGQWCGIDDGGEGGETTPGAWKGLNSTLCLKIRGTDGRDAIKEKLLLKIPLVPQRFVIR